VLIDEVWSSPYEELPPSRVGCSQTKVRGSTVGVDINRVSLPVVGLNGLADWIEEELLCSSTLVVHLDNKVACANGFNNSLHMHC
jgi:hypothetical protein